MKSAIPVVVLFTMTIASLAQVPDLTEVLWNGDWLSSQRDQLVHGEEYRGYPGPLVKMLAAVEFDANHPAVDFELRFNVQREALYWNGQCNGWAAATLLHEEPTSLVINGVKLFEPEVKALLTSIYKDNLRHYLTARVADGMSPKVLDDVLAATIGRGEPVIFDVDISEAIWNFPVATYTKNEAVSGDWTLGTITVGYVATMEMTDFTGPTSIDYHSYTYRYPTGSNTGYEWVGSSIGDHPNVAWTPSLPYSPQLWELSADRYFNLGTYDWLYDLASQPGTEVDLYEPNDNEQQATALNRQLVLASLHSGDIDVYTVPLAKGEALDAVVKVYDGPEISIRLLNHSGQVLETYTDSSQVNLDFVATQTSPVILELTRNEETADTFYQIVFSEADGTVIVTEQETSLIAMNLDDTDIASYGRTKIDLAANSSVEILDAPHDGQFRSSGDVLWTLERRGENYLEKEYIRDHKPALSYQIPHLTFKNDWDTRLELAASMGQSAVDVRTFDNQGEMIEVASLQLDEDGRFRGSLRDVLNSASISRGAWFELDAKPGSLSGSAVFCREALNDWVRIDISSKPINGEIPILGVRAPTTGWTGVALVNTSGVENEIQYRAYTDRGTIVDEGLFVMRPGAKWLNTTAAFAPSLPEGGSLVFFAQYDANALVIQHEYQPRSTYGMRALSYFQDAITTAYFSVPEDWQESAVVVANLNRTSVHALFEGYDSEGVLQGRFHTVLGNTIKSYEVRYASIAQIMENGVVNGDVSQIRKFKLTAVEPIYCYEIVGDQSQGTRTVSRVLPFYRNP